MNDIGTWYTERTKTGSDTITDIVAIALMHLRKLDTQRFREQLSPNHFREEFGEISIHMPRQMGHTTAAALLLVACPDSIVICRNKTHRDEIYRMVRENTFVSAEDKNNSITRVCTIANIGPGHFRGVDGTTLLIFDGASMMHHEIQKLMPSLYDVELVVKLQ